MGSDFNFVKSAVIAVSAVMDAVVYAAADFFVGFAHKKITSLNFLILLFPFFKVLFKAFWSAERCFETLIFKRFLPFEKIDIKKNNLVKSIEVSNF